MRAAEPRPRVFRRAATSAGFLLAIAALATRPTDALAEGRYTVCSITINSSDEIDTLKKYLPESAFQFVELTDHARSSDATDATPWFTRACHSGVQCDVLVVSGHFGNTWAGNFGTTFAGDSGLTLSLEQLEQHTCDNSCPGILRQPLEAFLFGCRTLAAGLPEYPLSRQDLALLAKNGVPASMAERIVEEARYKGSDTSNRHRMRFVFAGVPRLYGFSDVGPLGEHVRPLLESYFETEGSYVERLKRLAATRSMEDATTNHNQGLAQALQVTSFAQCGGLDLSDPDYLRGGRICFLRNGKHSLASRLRHVEMLLDHPGFLNYLPAIKAFLREHPSSSLSPAELAALERIHDHERARDVMMGLIGTLKSPVLRLEMVSVARAVGWMSAERALQVEREIIVKLLRPPIYGEGRNLVCGLDPALAKLVDIRAEDLRPEIYQDEHGIQALACLRPSDERIHLELSRSLFDSREWIARNAAIALMQIKPAGVDVQLALAEQLKRSEPGPRQWAGEALREIKVADPRVIETIRSADPSFTIDWLSAAPGGDTSGG